MPVTYIYIWACAAMVGGNTPLVLQQSHISLEFFVFPQRDFRDSYILKRSSVNDHGSTMMKEKNLVFFFVCKQGKKPHWSW